MSGSLTINDPDRIVSDPLRWTCYGSISTTPALAGLENAEADIVIKHRTTHRSGFAMWALVMVLGGSGLLVGGCVAPPMQLDARLIDGLPDEIDADAVGDLDWFVITSDDLDALEIVAFDQKAGAGVVTGAAAEIDGNSSLAYSGVTSYHWSQGEAYGRMDDITPGLTLQLWDAEAHGAIRFDLAWSRRARRVILHGSCRRGTTTISARVGEVDAETVIASCTSDEERRWAYELAVTNPVDVPAWVAVRTETAPDPFASVTISGAFVSTTR